MKFDFQSIAMQINTLPAARQQGFFSCDKVCFNPKMFNPKPIDRYSISSRLDWDEDGIEANVCRISLASMLVPVHL